MWYLNPQWPKNSCCTLHYEAATFSLHLSYSVYSWPLRSLLWLTLIFALLFHTSQFKSHVAILNLFTTSALRAVDGYPVRPLTHERQLVSSAVSLKVKHSDWFKAENIWHIWRATYQNTIKRALHRHTGLTVCHRVCAQQQGGLCLVGLVWKIL